tara:strand:- start:1054 stop:1344 length:291 start_codon:yes stop_codon:yes gene_type:complete
MSFVGKPVLNRYGDNIRYGIVQSEEMKGKWKHFVVKWTNDEIYVASMKHLTSLRAGKDYTKHTYRVDELLFIDVDKQLKDLRNIKRNLKNEFKEMA